MLLNILFNFCIQLFVLNEHWRINLYVNLLDFNNKSSIFIANLLRFEKFFSGVFKLWQIVKFLNTVCSTLSIIKVLKR